jgi:hypothetical protein
VANKQYQVFGRAFWEAVVDEFEATGGLTQREFAEQKGINHHTFSDWVYRLRREQSARQMQDYKHESAARFVELDLDALKPGRVQGAVVLELATARVHFEHTPEPLWLAQFFIALQGQGGGPC